MEGDEKRIDQLIELTEHNLPYRSHGEAQIYEELLRCSIRSGHRYGQALAYINLSRVYQEMQRHQQYTQCIRRAYEIAREAQYADILTRYYNLEGIRYMESDDAANALRMYLAGIQTAVEISDHRLCAIFYNNIAEIFFGNYDYDTAIVYYRKALGTLEQIPDDTQRRYRENFTKNLITAFCLKGNLEKAKEYLQLCKGIDCQDHIDPFAQQEAELRVLLLEGKHDEALRCATALLGQVRTCSGDDTLLFYTYSFLCDAFLDLHQQENARLCLSALEQINMEVSKSYAIDTQKRTMRYHQIFGIKDDSVYQTFYELTLQLELHHTKAISDSLSAAVSLYETAREQRLTTQECQNLEASIQYDSLTGIYNRRVFDQLVTDCMGRRDAGPMAYLMIDIDYFKEYNDCYGHPGGDEILKAVSALLQEALPEQAYLARYGGDEFACLLHNQTLEEVERLLQRIQAQLAARKIEHRKAKCRTHLTLSIGAYYTHGGADLNLTALIQRADEALYQVKKSGRNGYRIVLDHGAPT